jgi:ribonuclease VapC
MALSLKDPETDRLAREVSKLTGESLTQAVRTALAERLQRERRRQGRKGRDLADELDALAEEFADDVRLISAVTRVEAACVVEGRWGEPGRVGLDRFLRLTNAEIVAVTPDQAELAVETFRRYGKGRHPIGLNIGDCFSYALAKSTSEPLLFKGNDFSQTDIVPAYRR